MIKSENSFKSFFQGFESDSHMIRFILTVSALSIIIFFLITSIIDELASGSNLKVRSIPDGATIIEIRDEPEEAFYLLPASKMWANTGITLEPGQKISITASGYVNLAFHRLSNSAVNDEQPRHSWIGPDGGELNKPSEYDHMRKKNLIDTRSSFGKLLAVLVPSGAPTPGPRCPRPENIQVVGSHNDNIVNQSGKNSMLWLVVNDTYLIDDSLSMNAYIGNEKALRNKVLEVSKDTIDVLRESVPKDSLENYIINRIELEKKSKRDKWYQIRDEQYWHMWWDDNIGFYLVQIKFL